MWLWLALVLGALVFVLVALASPYVRRAVATYVVGLRYALAWALARVGGRKNVAPEMLRRAFEDLGPTYIKLGQIVASSHGLFPRAYVEEFQKVLDRVKPFPLHDVDAILRAELGRPAEEVFASFERVPLASASIAQVHGAVLDDGRDVVVKVQRPRIRALVDADVGILRSAAELLAVLPTAELANPTGIIEDFDTTIHEELDFLAEADNLREFNRIMRELGHADIAAPQVVDELTTERVLTMERFRGVRVDDVERIRAMPVDAEERLVHGVRAWLQCLLFYGFFHGDVHAGNLMLLEDGRLGFLDFGIIGRFDDAQRRLVADYVLSFATGDFKHLGEVMLTMNSVRTDVDLDVLARDLDVAYKPLRTQSLGEMKYAEILPGILRTAVKHKIRLPNEFVLVTKQLLFFDRYARLLAPKLNLFTDPRLIMGLAEDLMKVRAGMR